MLSLLYFLVFATVLGLDTKLEKYAKQFSPETIIDRDHISRKYPKFLMEVTSSFGMNEETIRFIEAAIENHFSGNMRNSHGLNEISEVVEDILGSYWSVNIFEDPYMFSATAFRRSPSFVVLDVNGIGIAVVKEAP